MHVAMPPRLACLLLGSVQTILTVVGNILTPIELGSLACFFSNSCCPQGSPRALSRSAEPCSWCVAKKSVLDYPGSRGA